MNSFKLPILTFLFLIAFSPALSLADTPLEGRSELHWRYGHERALLMTEFWAPFVQDEDSVLWGDIRLMGDDQDSREGNAGLGYREIVEVPVLGEGVAGVHGWVDRRITERGTSFHQVTGGVEWLGEDLDIRANVYVPLSSEKRHGGDGTVSAPFFAGTGLFVTQTGGDHRRGPRGL